MPVATFNQSNFTSQDASTYKAAIDGDLSVLARGGQAFAPHAAASPNMTVIVDAGFVFDGLTTTTQAQQPTGAIAAPAASPRIDLVVCDIRTGAVTVVTGTEASNPSVPAVPIGKFPVAQIALTVGVTAITNSMITDVRCVTPPPERVTGRSITASGSTLQSDLGKSLELNGTFPLTLSSTVGAGWWAMLKNIGSGIITVVPQSGLVDGLGSLPLQAGQGILLAFDGVNFYTYGLGGSGNPTGTIINSACSSVPTGYLLCDGSAVSRSAYAALFTAIGTTYGAGDGSSTFNIPDARGVVLRGVDGGRGIDSGRTLGSYQGDAIASHAVSVGISDPGHYHNLRLLGLNNGTSYNNHGFNDTSYSATYGPDNNYYTYGPTETSTTGITASGSYPGAAETRMKNLAVNYFIKY